MNTEAVLTLGTHVWPTMRSWLHSNGFTVKAVPHGPGQIPRHHVTATDLTKLDIVTGLNKKELFVLQGMSTGMTNSAIGRGLGASEDTVKRIARGIFRKFKANDRAHAVAIAYQRGIFPSMASDEGSR